MKLTFIDDDVASIIGDVLTLFWITEFEKLKLHPNPMWKSDPFDDSIIVFTIVRFAFLDVVTMAGFDWPVTFTNDTFATVNETARKIEKIVVTWFVIIVSDDPFIPL